MFDRQRVLKAKDIASTWVQFMDTNTVHTKLLIQQLNHWCDNVGGARLCQQSSESWQLQDNLRCTIWGEVKRPSQGMQGTRDCWFTYCKLCSVHKEPGLSNTQSASPFLPHKTSIMPSLWDGYRHRSQKKICFWGGHWAVTNAPLKSSSQHQLSKPKFKNQQDPPKFLLRLHSSLDKQSKHYN